MYRNTYVEVNLDILGSNVKKIITEYNKYKYYIGVVKGNAYGHDSYIVNTLIENGVNYLAVSSLEEALDIRIWNQEIPILCLVPINLDSINVCIENNITITVHNYDYYQELISKKLSGILKIHLKIDSGMNRLGFNDKYEIKEIYDQLVTSSNIILEGIYTHFATSGINDELWDRQLNNFEIITKLIDLKKIPIVHLGRSATLVQHKKIKFANGIRLGIIMYGFVPSTTINYSLKGKIFKLVKDYIRKVRKIKISETIKTCSLKLESAFTLYSQVIDLKRVYKGDFVGYNGLYRFKKDSFIAVIPIGYSDGLNTNINKSYVMINGNKYNIVGIVNMNMITVEVDEKVKLYDKVTVIGGNVPVKDVAKLTRTGTYQVITNINKNVPRVFLKNGKVKKIVEYR